MSNIDFMTSDVMQLPLDAKITFSQGGATDLQNKHLMVIVQIGIYLEAYFVSSQKSLADMFFQWKSAK